MPRITDDMMVLDPETGEFTFEIKHLRNQDASYKIQDQEPESLSKLHRVSPNRTQFPGSLSKVTVRTLALKCTLCKNKPIIVKSENELNLHFKDIHQDIRFCCHLCSSIFGNLTVLFNHIQRNHSEQNPNVESVALFSEMTMSRVGYLAGNQNRCAADKVRFSVILVVELWHFRLWSFQDRDTKLERFLTKNQHYSNEITKF
jgi:hypothetical protein